MIIVKTSYPGRQFTKISQRKSFSEEIKSIIASTYPDEAPILFYFFKTEKHTPKDEGILVEIDACCKRGSFHIGKTETRVSGFLKTRFSDVVLKVTSGVHSSFHHFKQVEKLEKK